MGRFVTKRVISRRPQKELYVDDKAESINNIQENTEVMMTTSEKVALANDVLGQTHATKRIKKDKGLIERAGSSKTILTEDNKELLND